MTSRQPKALVLAPAGPLGWASYHLIYPCLEKIWNSCGFEILKIWYPRPRLTRSVVEKCRRASKLILPLGISHSDALWTLQELRRTHDCQTPAVIMVASDLTAGYKSLVYYQKVLTTADRFVTNCTAEAELFRLAFGKKAKVGVIPLPVEKLAPPKTKSQARAKLGISRGEKMILYAGRVSTQKNLHSLVVCLDRLKKTIPGICLYIAGPSDELGFPRVKNQNRHRYIHELSQLVVSLSLEEHVKFVGNLGQEELRDYLMACDVQATLSLHSGEDFGYAIAQGLQLGIPTVVSRWGGGVDFAKHCGAFEVPVFISENGPKVELRKAVQAFSRAFAEPARTAPVYLSEKSISSKWRRVTRAGRGIRAKPLALNKGFRVTRSPTHFPSARDPLYQKISRVYANSPKGSATRVELNPLFDSRRGYLWDPISEKRNWKFSRTEGEVIQFATKNGPIALRGLDSKRRRIAKKLLKLGVFLPA